MKHHYSPYLIALFALFTSCNSNVQSDKNIPVTTPFGLMIEFLRPNNSIIHDKTPEFSWIVPQKAQKQTAFQIQVYNTTKDKKTEVIWDSGKIQNEHSSNNVYRGQPLKTNLTYYWKVKVWGVGDWESEFSTPQTFKYIPTENSLITSQNSFQIDSISPEIVKTGKNTYLLDFKKDAFATLLLNYKTTANDSLEIRLGEQLLDDKTINQNPQDHIRFQAVKLPVHPNKTTYTLNLKPNRRNTLPKAVALPDSFPVLMPFRYVEITDSTSKIEAKNFKQLAYHSYFENDNSAFTCSDTILNNIWDLCKYSIKATSFAGLYVDGDRERIPYEADAYLNQLSHYATDREYSNARLTIEYFMQHPTWPTEWQLHMALMFYKDYMYTGNTELLKTYYEQLKVKTLMELAREDGLISTSSPQVTPEFMANLGFNNPNDKLSDIVDWPPAQKDTGWKLATAEGERDGYVFKPINTVVNCFYYENMLVMNKIATALGYYTDAQKFKRQAEQVKTAINTKLFDNNQGTYIDGEGTSHASLHANMMALAFHLVPEEHIPSVVKFIKSRGMACSVYGSQYLLEALYNAGESTYALELMTATHDRSWYNMINIGATITLEAWDMKYKPNADWNHAWGATPANIIPMKMWGISPKEPGGSRIMIKPQLAGLTSSKIKVPLLKGFVHATYKKAETDNYTFEIPSNIIAELELNLKNAKQIKIRGEIYNGDKDIMILTPGTHHIEIQF